MIDILRGQRLETLRPPCGIGKIRHAEIGTPGDHIAAQHLVADQSQEVRIIDRSHHLAVRQPPVPATLTMAAVAGGTALAKTLRPSSLFPVPAPSRPGPRDEDQYGGASQQGQLDQSPMGLDACRQNLDLLGRQVSAPDRGKRRHQRAGTAFGNETFQLRIRDQSQEQLVVERRGRAQPAVHSMATGAVLLKEDGERSYFIRLHVPLTGPGLTGKIAAGRRAGQEGQ